MRKWTLGLLAMLSATPLFACRRDAAKWVSDGGALGRRVRAGDVSGVSHQRFHSALLDKEVGLVVATPPGYGHSDSRHPVVYLFPGIGGDEWSYLASVGLDNSSVRTLFAHPSDAPILVFANPADSGGFGRGARVLGQELVAFVDRQYRTRALASGRSLEGFSLGGATALSLLTQFPEVFGRAVGLSSACYLLKECDALRAELKSRSAHARGKVLLGVGAIEREANKALSQEFAPMVQASVVELARADHDWAAQLRTPMQGQEGKSFGVEVAEFHLSGFAKSAAP